MKKGENILIVKKSHQLIWKMKLIDQKKTEKVKKRREVTEA